jgi:hypothetical protein
VASNPFSAHRPVTGIGSYDPETSDFLAHPRSSYLFVVFPAMAHLATFGVDMGVPTEEGTFAGLTGWLVNFASRNYLHLLL